MTSYETYSSNIIELGWKYSRINGVVVRVDDVKIRQINDIYEFVMFDENGEVTYQVEFYENGNKKCESFRMNGELHRDNEPAYLRFRPTGNLFDMQYWTHGQLIYREMGNRKMGNKN